MYFRLKVTGVEQIPPTGPVILVPNHASFLDPPLLSSAVPRVIYFLMLHQHYYHPWFHWLFRRLPCIPMKRSAAGGTAFKHCLQVLIHERILCVFPEGGISREQKAHGLKHGAVLLALHTHAPIVPVGIIGASKALALKQWFPRPRPISINFGKPLYVPASDSRDKVFLQQLTEQIMEQVQALLLE